MNKLTKNKKKKGFTLIELIAVIAIIGILAAVLVPKVIGYMDDAKKSKVVAQARSVVMAFETYNGKESKALPETTTIADLNKAMGGSVVKYEEYVDFDTLDMIDGKGASTIKIEDCRKAADGKDKSTGALYVVKLDGGIWKGAFEQ